jgi:hypothetical protein
MEEVLKTLGLSITGVVVGLAFLGWLARSIILHILRSDLERHKAKLKADSERELESFKALLKTSADREMEALRSDLQRKSLEHEVRFRHLHERRAETVAELYRKLAVAERAFAQFCGLFEPGSGEEIMRRREINLKDAQTKVRALDDYFRQTELFFDDGLCKQMEGLLGEFHDAWIDIQMRDVEKDARERATPVIEAARTISEVIPGLRRDLAAQFRRLLE